MSQGAGKVADRVWNSVPQVGTEAEWLQKIPSDQEIRAAYNAMKLDKAGGEDAVLAEYLRYGGAALREKFSKWSGLRGSQQWNPTKTTTQTTGPKSGI